MEPAASSSDQGFVCQTCGDKGITNAFVYCVNCLDFVIHRYCLDIVPSTSDELVIWYCEDCQVRYSVSQKKEAANSGHIKANKQIHSLSTGKTKCNNRTYAYDIPKKKRTEGKRFAASLAAKEKCNKIQQRKIRFLEDCSLLAWNLIEWKYLDEPQPSYQSCEFARSSSDSSSMGSESDKADNDKYHPEVGSALSQPVIIENNKQEKDYRYGLPVIDQIWRGSFNVTGTKYEGLAAHISTKACYRVFTEANMLTSSLDLEMHPRTYLWPKSFQECEPSDDHIALYFLPGDPLNVKAFDSLVLDMMDNALALRAYSKNAELLLFTSNLLPPLFWRIYEKYYLWGVFKGEQNDSTSVASHDLSKDAPNEGIDVTHTVKMMKTLDAHSPRSHLSNNGIDDVVEPFVEYLDKPKGQPVLCDRGEHIEELEFVDRSWSTVRPRTSRAPRRVLKPPPISEWIHPRLSQHHPSLQRKLYMQKLSPVDPLILEKSIKQSVFVGSEIFECFMRIGWDGILNFEVDEVYQEAVIEWMSTLKRTGSSVVDMKLTGKVNGEKATLDMKFIREICGVDTGIMGHPEAEYEYLTEETFSGKQEQNVNQWRKMTDAIFTTVNEGTLCENLTPLAKVLWRIGMRNIHPRVGSEREVFPHEVPIIYSLATGNHAVSYAHLVMMNIWRAYELKEMTCIPHAWLISRFLKLKNVVGRNMLPKLMIQENSDFIARLNYDYIVFRGTRRENDAP